MAQDSYYYTDQVQRHTSALASQRLARINATQQKAVIANQVSGLQTQRSQVVSTAKAAVASVAPQLASAPITSATLSSLPPSHPANQALAQYIPTINDIDTQIAHCVANYKTLTAVEQQAMNNESDIARSYNNLTADSEEPSVPASTLSQNLPDSPSTTSVDKDSHFIANVIGLEFIDPEVQEFIFYHCNYSDLGTPQALATSQSTTPAVAAAVQAVTPSSASASAVPGSPAPASPDDTGDSSQATTTVSSGSTAASVVASSAVSPSSSSSAAPALLPSVAAPAMSPVAITALVLGGLYLIYGWGKS